MIENYNSGIQITYKLYTDEEIAAVPTRQKAEIYYFPGSDPGGKFVLVIGGNAIHTSAEMREGFPRRSGSTSWAIPALCCGTALATRRQTTPRWKM